MTSDGLSSPAESAEAIFSKALGLHRAGRFEEARRLYERTIELSPCAVQAVHLLGIIAAQTHRHDDAVGFFSKAAALAPQIAAIHNDLGNAHAALARYESAIESYDRAIALATSWADPHYNRANALFEQQLYPAAAAGYRRAIALAPTHAAAFANLGNALRELGDHREAAASYERALALKPDNPGVLNNRGVVLLDAHWPEAAIACFEAAVALKPDYADAHVNLGHALRRLHRYEAAAAAYGEATRHRPDYAQAHADQGICLYDLRRYEAAVQSFDRARALDPSVDVSSMRLHCLQQLCDWRGRAQELDQLTARIERREPASNPFLFFALCGSAVLQLELAASWADQKCGVQDALAPPARRGRSGKIRIGYFSPDFYNHPVSILLADIFEMHDRTKFEVNALSYGPPIQDTMRQRLVSAFDRFLDVHGKSERDIAIAGRDLGLDIAVDLAGFTGEAKIFAYRPASIQVSYLGYVGTLGADFMDYLIADDTLIPAAERGRYREKILYLPSYQANSRTRAAAEGITRAQLGLPADGFVFACFNSNHKITPDVFDTWMNLLRRVEHSSLLLYAESPAAEQNLRREARERGIADARLVFSPRLPYAEYLARFRAADLFLDTAPFNGGTTVADALWAGLPVLTLSGEAFSSRYAASLLTALGLPELITVSRLEYEETAAALAADAQRLATLRCKVAEGLAGSALFDPARFTRTLEAGFSAIYERDRAGLAPAHVWVRE
jgi:predicted O-linked N-acetylglucosamine transferase (SPINDLY family)